ncbi:MAG: TlpA family protein disulfide reductase [Opitutae bacterium]|nr:TlpA family protein disulfide reductase [Opitutae bacterium]
MKNALRLFLVPIFAVAALAFASGCKPKTEAVAARPAVKLPVVSKAPAWKMTDLAGHEVSSESLKGKVVVVDFWATWCGPCIAEIPGYVALQNKYGKDGLVIVGASVDRKGPAHVKQFADKNGMNYTLVMADDAVQEAFGGFDAIPTTFLIDRDGNIRHQKTGSMPHEEYEKLVTSLL